MSENVSAYIKELWKNKMSSHPTIADVAHYAGVSTATVSRVINKSGNVTPETIARVQTAVTALDYAPHTSAQVLASRRTQTIGLITPTISDLFFTDLLRGIEQTVYENNYTLLIHATHGRPLDDIIPTLPLNHHNTDGLVIFTNSVDDGRLQKAARTSFSAGAATPRPHPPTQIFPVSPLKTRRGHGK
ncbi:MAG: LacI family transcriptional regulator [Anaerolineae bacterium]|nr:LacI family transcriptional regulator [Anaerolineae bacterium]